MAAVTPEPRTATVTAVAKSSLLSLDQRDLEDLLENHPGVARVIIQALASYIRERTVMMADLKKQLDQ
jgi:CRP-like cAMP-binding protein